MSARNNGHQHEQEEDLPVAEEQHQHRNNIVGGRDIDHDSNENDSPIEEDQMQLQPDQDNNPDDEGHNNFENNDEVVPIAAELAEGFLEGDDGVNDNIRNDIPEELVDMFFEALDNIPLESKLEYTKALLHAPGLIDRESNPVVFLRYADNDPAKAAKALCDYWKRRVEIFGPDKAFEPMKLNGACSDIVQSIANMPTMFRILPNDDYGRTVLCTDRTNVNLSEFDDQMDFVKHLWYVYHNHLKDIVSVQKTGLVLIVINKNTNYFKRSVLRYLWRNCLPFKIYSSHMCYSSLLSRILMPTVKYFRREEPESKRMELHQSIKSPTTLQELKEFGLNAANLPTSIGGTYREKPSWVIESENIINSNMKKKKSTNSDWRSR